MKHKKYAGKTSAKWVCSLTLEKRSSCLAVHFKVHFMWTFQQHSKNSSVCPASEFIDSMGNSQGQIKKNLPRYLSKPWCLQTYIYPISLCIKNANVDFSLAENSLKTCGNFYNWRGSLKQMVILFSKRKLSSGCGRWGKEVSSKMSEC